MVTRRRVDYEYGWQRSRILGLGGITHNMPDPPWLHTHQRPNPRSWLDGRPR
jgi:hypothetical protein